MACGTLMIAGLPEGALRIITSRATGIVMLDRVAAVFNQSAAGFVS